MAIFSLHCKIIGKGQQKSGAASVLSAVAAAAYRAGEKLQDIAAGMTHDFTKKGGVVHSEIMLPVGGPERLRDRAALWNEVQNLEKRKDGQYCREIMIAMPTEFTNEENIRLARAYIRKTFVDKGMIADFSFHDPFMGGGHRNPHIHVMLTMRELTPDGKLGKKNRAWNDDSNMERWRERWATTCNKWLEKGGFEARIDHRTNAAQGLGTLPTVHLGSKAAALERKGVKTAKGNINRSICAYNIAKECGVEEPSILSRVELQWQYVRQFRGDVGSPRSLSRKSRSDGLAEKMRDTDRTGVQRRTYTLLRNVVRSGQTPTPPDGEKDALRGDRNNGKTDSGAGQRDETATLSGDAAREHAAVSPTLQHAAAVPAFGQRLSVAERLANAKAAVRQVAAERETVIDVEYSEVGGGDAQGSKQTRHCQNYKQARDKAIRLTIAESLAARLMGARRAAGYDYRRSAQVSYNIKLMSGTLAFLSEHGIENYAQLQGRMNIFAGRAGRAELELKQLDNDLLKCKQLLGASLNYHNNKAATEKHIPSVTADGDSITVQVGSVRHPMLPEHHIEFVYVQTETCGYKKRLQAGDAPIAKFNLSGEKALAVYEYCNLHGLWRISL